MLSAHFSDDHGIGTKDCCYADKIGSVGSNAKDSIRNYRGSLFYCETHKAMHRQLTVVGKWACFCVV